MNRYVVQESQQSNARPLTTSPLARISLCSDTRSSDGAMRALLHGCFTSQQARFSRRPSRRAKGPGIGAMGAPVNEESVLDLQASRSQMTSDTDELLALRDALRACPKCQSEEFTDRRVTRARPASPNASRTELPREGLPLPDGTHETSPVLRRAHPLGCARVGRALVSSSVGPSSGSSTPTYGEHLIIAGAPLAKPRVSARPGGVT